MFSLQRRQGGLGTDEPCEIDKILKPGFLLLFPEPGTPPSGTEEVLGLSFLVAHLQAGEGLWSVISGSPTSGAGEGLGQPCGLSSFALCRTGLHGTDL